MSLPPHAYSNQPKMQQASNNRMQHPPQLPRLPYSSIPHPQPNLRQMPMRFLPNQSFHPYMHPNQPYFPRNQPCMQGYNQFVAMNAYNQYNPTPFLQPMNAFNPQIYPPNPPHYQHNRMQIPIFKQRCMNGANLRNGSSHYETTIVRKEPQFIARSVDRRNSSEIYFESELQGQPFTKQTVDRGKASILFYKDIDTSFVYKPIFDMCAGNPFEPSLLAAFPTIMHLDTVPPVEAQTTLSQSAHIQSQEAYMPDYNLIEVIECDDEQPVVDNDKILDLKRYKARAALIKAEKLAKSVVIPLQKIRNDVLDVDFDSDSDAEIVFPRAPKLDNPPSFINSGALRPEATLVTPRASIRQLTMQESIDIATDQAERIAVCSNDTDDQTVHRQSSPITPPLKKRLKTAPLTQTINIKSQHGSLPKYAIKLSVRQSRIESIVYELPDEIEIEGFMAESVFPIKKLDYTWIFDTCKGSEGSSLLAHLIHTKMSAWFTIRAGKGVNWKLYQVHLRVFSKNGTCRLFGYVVDK